MKKLSFEEKIRRFEQEVMQSNEQLEEEFLERRVSMNRAEQAALSYLLNNGPSNVEEIISCAPDIIDHVLGGLKAKGMVDEENGYWKIKGRKYTPQ